MSVELSNDLERARQIARDTFQRWPHLQLGAFPTPVRELPRLRKHLGCGARLWIKNDDYSGPAFGGNKIRKLEYVLAQALADKIDVVFTSGGITSNHARSTAGLCARLGISCELVLNIPPGQPRPKSGRPASLLLDEMFGARVHVVVRGIDRQPEMERLAAEVRQDGRRAMVIPLGASTPLGALGFVRAGQELADQAKSLSLDLRKIFHATSSGGTQAGLAEGVALFGPRDAEVVAVSVDNPSADIVRAVRKILSGLNHSLGLPETYAHERVVVDDGFIGDGYAIPSPAGNEATALFARTEGVILDPVYTGKSAASFIQAAKGNSAKDGDLLFWHTGGQMALFQEVAS
jgi:1-aminocyclopropane-1-carboxylate deaminase/D-cysteine desulfhydrase-like pyridoxal-dependent ACC family enzyme